MTLAERIAELIEQHGSLRAAARVVQLDPGYLSRLAAGDTVRPGNAILRRMGLRRVVTYERTTPLPPPSTRPGSVEGGEAAIHHPGTSCRQQNDAGQCGCPWGQCARGMGGKS